MTNVASPTTTHEDTRRPYLRSALEIILSDEWGTDTQRTAQAEQDNPTEEEQPHG